MKIVFRKHFVKKLHKLDPKVKVAFEERLNIFRLNKFDQILYNHFVDKRYPGCRSINITGNYRVIFKDFGELIYFIKIGTHSELYD